MNILKSILILFFTILILPSCGNKESSKGTSKEVALEQIDSAQVVVMKSLKKSYSDTDLKELKLKTFELSHSVWNKKLLEYAMDYSKDYLDIYESVLKSGSDQASKYKGYLEKSNNYADSLMEVQKDPDTENTYYVVNALLVKMDTIINKDYYLSTSFEFADARSK
jgi:uncharacterized protein YwqG